MLRTLGRARRKKISKENIPLVISNFEGLARNSQGGGVKIHDHSIPNGGQKRSEVSYIV